MICKTCNLEFEDKTRKRKYCCAECYHASHRTKRTCIKCGGKLTFKNKKYCSWGCRTGGAPDPKVRYMSDWQKMPRPELTDEQKKERAEKRNKNHIRRAIQWQKDNPAKVYAAQIAQKDKEFLNILYECACEHPRKHNHHYDYSKPLDVIKLCPSCHAGWHRKLRSLQPALAEAI